MQPGQWVLRFALESPEHNTASPPRRKLSNQDSTARNCYCLVLLLFDNVSKVKDRHIKCKQDKKNDPAYHDCHCRLQKLGQPVHRILDVPVVEVGHLVQHLIQVSRLFAGGHHSGDNRWKLPGLLQWKRDSRAFLDKSGYIVNGLDYDHVSRRVAGSLTRP